MTHEEANGSIFRVKKNSNYTVMSNFHLKDTRISLKAVGLLSKMLSLPENWDYSINGLVKICKENHTAIRNTLNELKEYGYLKINKYQTASGLFQYEYIIYEYPQQGEPDIENPYMDNPDVDNPNMENPIQLNTNKLNTKELNTNKDICDVPNETKQFIDLYNSICTNLSKANKLTEVRKRKIRARLKDLPLSEWERVFEKCNNSDFCCGKSSKWQASLDWLIVNDNNYVKVLEGKYDNKFSLRNNLKDLQEKGMDII